MTKQNTFNADYIRAIYDLKLFIAVLLINEINKQGLTKGQAADRLVIPESKVLAIFSARFDSISLELLAECCQKLDIKPLEHERAVKLSETIKELEQQMAANSDLFDFLPEQERPMANIKSCMTSLMTQEFKDRKFNRKQASEFLDVSASTVGLIINADLHRLNVDTLLRYMQKLGFKTESSYSPHEQNKLTITISKS